MAAFFGVIDNAERPEVYYQCGHVGNFIGRSRNLWGPGKSKCLSISRLAGRYVYKFGLDANEIHFYNFLQEFKKNPVAVKLANGPIS